MKIKTEFWKETNPTTWAARYSKHNTICMIIILNSIIVGLWMNIPILTYVNLFFFIILLIISISYNKNQKQIEKQEKKK